MKRLLCKGEKNNGKEPLAVEMFNQMAPGMLEGPMIQFVYQMEIAEMLGAAPDAKPLFEAVIAALNSQAN